MQRLDACTANTNKPEDETWPSKQVNYFFFLLEAGTMEDSLALLFRPAMVLLVVDGGLIR